MEDDITEKEFLDLWRDRYVTAIYSKKRNILILDADIKAPPSLEAIREVLSYGFSAVAEYNTEGDSWSWVFYKKEEYTEEEALRKAEEIYEVLYGD